MVTFECFVDTCPNCNIPYNFVGFPESAVCGGCGAILEPTDSRPDPEPEPLPEQAKVVASKTTK